MITTAILIFCSSFAHAQTSSELVGKTPILGRGVQDSKTRELMLIGCPKADCKQLRIIKLKTNETPQWKGHPFEATAFEDDIRKLFDQIWSDQLKKSFDRSEMRALTNQDGWNWSESPTPVDEKSFLSIESTLLLYSEKQYVKANEKKIELRPMATEYSYELPASLKNRSNEHDGAWVNDDLSISIRLPLYPDGYLISQNGFGEDEPKEWGDKYLEWARRRDFYKDRGPQHICTRFGLGAVVDAKSDTSYSLYVPKRLAIAIKEEGKYDQERKYSGIVRLNARGEFMSIGQDGGYHSFQDEPVVLLTCEPPEDRPVPISNRFATPAFNTAQGFVVREPRFRMFGISRQISLDSDLTGVCRLFGFNEFIDKTETLSPEVPKADETNYYIAGMVAKIDETAHGRPIPVNNPTFVLESIRCK